MRRGLRWAIAIGVPVAALVVLEVLGWPGLAPLLAPRLVDGLTLHPASRVHLVRPGLTAPSFALTRGRPLAAGEGLALQWAWGDIWRWQRASAPLRLRQVQAQHLDIHWQRDAAGRSDWQAAENRAPTPLPVIDELLILQGQADIDDAPSALKAKAQFSTQANGHWRAEVDGVWRQQQLQLKAQADAGLPLLAAPGTNTAPTRVEAQLSQGRSRVRFVGTAASLLDARALQGQLEASGPSLAAVGRPVGVILPVTPPFQLQGQLTHAEGLWRLSGTQAKIGSSRLGGTFTFDTRPSPPMLEGELTGGPLKLADLGPAVGTDQAPTRAGRVLPDRPMDLKALGAMNAELRIRLSELDLGTTALAPLRPVQARLSLNDRLLRLSDLNLGVAGGTLRGSMQLDARADPPAWAAKLSLGGTAIERWLRPAKRQGKRAGEPAALVTGQLGAQADVTGHGLHLAALLGSMNGSLKVDLQRGSLSHLVTEAAGLDIAQGLGVFLKGDTNLPLQCAMLEARARAGVLRPRVAVIDNRDSRIELTGQVDLGSERLALRAVAHPKDFSPLTLRAPLRVEGTLDAPRVALEGGALAGRALVAIALGSLAPPAALLAFVDPGEKLPPLVCQTKPTR